MTFFCIQSSTNVWTRTGDPGFGIKVVTDSADVLVDTRGYIYLSDRKAGIYVLKYTGPKPGPALPVHTGVRD